MMMVMIMMMVKMMVVVYILPRMNILLCFTNFFPQRHGNQPDFEGTCCSKVPHFPLCCGADFRPPMAKAALQFFNKGLANLGSATVALAAVFGIQFKGSCHHTSFCISKADADVNSNDNNNNNNNKEEALLCPDPRRLAVPPRRLPGTGQTKTLPQQALEPPLCIIDRRKIHGAGC